MPYIQDNIMENNVLYSCISGNYNSEEPGFIIINDDDIKYYSFINDVIVARTKLKKSKESIITDIQGFQYWELSQDHTHNFDLIFKKKG